MSAPSCPRSCTRAWQAEAVEDGRLAAADAASFARHAEGCALCAAEARWLVELRRTAERWPVLPRSELEQRRSRNALLQRANALALRARPASAWSWRAAALLTAMTGALAFAAVLAPSAAPSRPSPPPSATREPVAARSQLTVSAGAPAEAPATREISGAPDQPVASARATAPVPASAMAGTTRATSSASAGANTEPARATSSTPAVAGAASRAGRDFAAAMAAFSAGEYGRADRLFAAFARAHAADARAEDAWFLRAVAHARRGELNASRAAAREYLRRYPNGLRRAEAERLTR